MIAKRKSKRLDRWWHSCWKKPEKKNWRGEIGALLSKAIKNGLASNLTSLSRRCGASVSSARWFTARAARRSGRLLVPSPHSIHCLGEFLTEHEIVRSPRSLLRKAGYQFSNSQMEKIRAEIGTVQAHRDRRRRLFFCHML